MRSGGGHSKQRIGATSLMYACQQGKSRQVSSIISAKPQAVYERERTMKTALHYCAESGDDGAISAAVLLDAAPELVSAQDQDGYSALHLAVIAGNLPLATLLLSRGAAPNMLDYEGHTPSHWATVCGEIESLELVLSRGGDANIGDMHGGRPLHYAAQMCGPASDMPADRRLGMAALTLLLRKGADPNLPDNHGRPPILWAASAGSSEALLVLMNAGASVAAADKDGLTALHCAASRGHTDCVETLISFCSAEADVIDNNGCSALFYAVTLGHADATQSLLNHGANTSRQDRKGRTAVHCGAAKGQLETIKVVSAWGGNLWSRTARGDYPLHEAVSSGRIALVSWFLSLRPDAVNAPNNDGRTPLHIAALHGNIEMAKTLLDSGSLVNPVMRTSKGSLATPFDSALNKGHRSCAKILQLHGGVPATRLNSESAALRGPAKKLSSMPTEVTAPDVETDKMNVKVLPSSKETNSAVSISTHKEITVSGRKPRVLQVYVEDDVMIRRIRPHEGSDSSIEERVRRRRRKRKSRLMSGRQRSKSEGKNETESSEDSPIEKANKVDIGEAKSNVEEKLVQTEVVTEPNLTAQTEPQIEPETAKVELTPTLSQNVKLSDESVKPEENSNLQVITALVHKEQDLDFDEDSLDLELPPIKNEEKGETNVDDGESQKEMDAMEALDENDKHEDDNDVVVEPNNRESSAEGIDERKEEERSDPIENSDERLIYEETNAEPKAEAEESEVNVKSDIVEDKEESEKPVDEDTGVLAEGKEEEVVETEKNKEEEQLPQQFAATDDIDNKETLKEPIEGEINEPVNDEKEMSEKELSPELSELNRNDAGKSCEKLESEIEESPTVEIAETSAETHDTEVDNELKAAETVKTDRDETIENGNEQEGGESVKSETKKESVSTPDDVKKLPSKEETHLNKNNQKSKRIKNHGIVPSKGLIKVLDDEIDEKTPRRRRVRDRKWKKDTSNESFEVIKYPDDGGSFDPDLSPTRSSQPADSGIEPSPIRGPADFKEKSRIPRACRKGNESNKETSLSAASVTQAVQYSVRKYHLERRIFHQLLELKRLQIRAGRASEAVLVKRLVDDYKRAGLMLGLQQYTGVYTFRAFEKYLYEQLRLLQSADKRMIPRLRSTEDIERLKSALRRTRVGEELLARPGLCTLRTHSCHHAAHAYTGVPCAAYINQNHHTMSKSAPYSGFLPKITNNETQGEVAKTLRYVDPSRPLKLELSHGPDKQVITLPTETLDKSKRYFVTFTIKSGEQRAKSELGHIHGTTV